MKSVYKYVLGGLAVAAAVGASVAVYNWWKSKKRVSKRH